MSKGIGRKISSGGQYRITKTETAPISLPPFYCINGRLREVLGMNHWVANVFSGLEKTLVHYNLALKTTALGL